MVPVLIISMHGLHARSWGGGGAELPEEGNSEAVYREERSVRETQAKT